MSIDLTPDSLSRLRELAGKANPGPWCVADLRYVVAADLMPVCDEAPSHPYDANLNYIAAASPDVVVALVDEIERLRAAVEAMVKAHNGVVDLLRHAAPEAHAKS